MAPIFELRGISKSFGRYSVLRDLSLGLNAGDFTLLLGANGTGKTTLLRLCAGLHRPERGEILFDGRAADPVKVPGLAHCGHNLFLYANLSVRENIELFATLLDVKTDIGRHLAAWRLTEQAERKVFQLSKGTQFRVSLCRTFLSPPRFLFLDEPTSALDEHALELLVQHARRVASGEDGAAGAVLVATHDVRRLRGAANRLVLLKGGTIAQDLEQLKQQHAPQDIEELKDAVIRSYFEANC